VFPNRKFLNRSSSSLYQILVACLSYANHLSRCGPHKLAKAFKFCLDTTLPPTINVESSESSYTSPASGVTSPQSLFIGSPSPLAAAGNVPDSRAQEEYFPITASLIPNDTSRPSLASVAGSESTSSTIIPAKRRPVLLLVEDNKINLRVWHHVHHLNPTCRLITA
jgi:hypothetical protein